MTAARTRIRRPRVELPTCGICGWELVWPECQRLELHWTVCPVHHCVVDYGRSCERCVAA